jgi:hypothetical protein
MNNHKSNHEYIPVSRMFNHINGQSTPIAVINPPPKQNKIFNDYIELFLNN